MSNFSAKLFLVIFLGTLGLGFSSVTNAAGYNVGWIPNYETDCPSSCKRTMLKFAIPGGVDANTGMASFFICVTQVGDEWRTGYNQWDKNSCTIGINGKEHQGEKYYCLCSTVPQQPMKSR
jgi:hypothetical protein